MGTILFENGSEYAVLPQGNDPMVGVVGTEGHNYVVYELEVVPDEEFIDNYVVDYLPKVKVFIASPIKRLLRWMSRVYNTIRSLFCS